MAWYPWPLRALVSGKPSVGRLMELCEENYHHLLRLAPELRIMEGVFLSRLEGAMDLSLEIQEQTPYTTLVHLTYFFAHETGQLPDPDAMLRVYHDSGQAEILELRQKALPLNRGVEHPTLDQKWKANLFLSKWLCYCAQQGHRFSEKERYPIAWSERVGRGAKEACS
jgi:uncharacterized protein YqiB (DUF1249 family)